MAVTTSESWSTLTVYKSQIGQAKNAQVFFRQSMDKLGSQVSIKNKLAGYSATIISLVFSSVATPASLAGLMHSSINTMNANTRRTHLIGLDYGYNMYDEMDTYMKKNGFDALKVQAYSMTYRNTNPVGSMRLLFGNQSGQQLGKTFKVVSALKNGQWL